MHLLIRWPNSTQDTVVQIPMSSSFESVESALIVALDGPRVQRFELMAVGPATFALTLPVTLLRAALLIAGPAIALGLVVQVALATASRVIPRLSTFPLSFGLVLASVILLTIVALPATLPAAGAPWFDLSDLHAR